MKKVMFIERVNAFIALLLIGVSYLMFHDKKICSSIGMGALIGGFNFAALYYIVMGFVHNEGRRFVFGIFALLKFIILVAILWAVVNFVPVNIVAFLVGLSIILVAVLIGYARI